MKELDTPASVLLDPVVVAGADSFCRSSKTAMLAVAFTDIVDSTKLRNELGEKKYERLREEHEQAVDLVVQEAGGRVLKSTGDGALMVFVEPSAGVEGVLNLHRSLTSHPYFKLRAGMDVGQVSLKSKGGVVADVFGRHVNRAARIQGLAEPGHLLASAYVYDCSVGWHQGSGVKWQEVGFASLKGFSGRHQIFEAYYQGLSKPQTLAFSADISYGVAGSDEIRFSRGRAPVRDSIAAQEVGSYQFNVRNKSARRLPRIVRNVRMPHEDPFPYFEFRIRLAVQGYRRSYRKRPSVLWVDDYPENNASFAKLLSKAGCRVVTRTTTDAALASLDEERFALLISDMGRGDNPTAGLELLKRARVRNKGIPTIIFASLRAVGNYGGAARREGAILCTPGFVTLLSGVAQVLDWWSVPR